MALGYQSIAPSLANTSPFLKGAPLGDVNQLTLSSVIAVMVDRDRSASKRPTHRRSAKSVSSLAAAPTATSGSLRLADVAKQHCMGVHTEDWREDMLPTRQYLPMQHIIGSLKRDRDDAKDPVKSGTSARRRAGRHSMYEDVAAASPRSDDSFMQMLRTPKRRRTLDDSYVEISDSFNVSPQWTSGYLDSEHIPLEIPRSALPGLNHVLNLSTITSEEHDAFSEYTPSNLEDPQLLMNEVLQLRGDMMDETKDDDTPGELDDSSSTINEFSPIVPPEREIEVRKAFEEFIDFSDSKRYIAKI